MTESYVMMALGDFRFSVSTAAYQSLQRTTTWRWAAVERVAVRPVQQFVGLGEDTIGLEGTIYPAYAGGFGQMDAMRTEANKGKPLMFVDGTGLVWGDFCITEISETQTVFFSNGLPRKVDFRLSLTRYGDRD